MAKAEPGTITVAVTPDLAPVAEKLEELADAFTNIADAINQAVESLGDK